MFRPWSLDRCAPWCWPRDHSPRWSPPRRSEAQSINKITNTKKVLGISREKLNRQRERNKQEQCHDTVLETVPWASSGCLPLSQATLLVPQLSHFWGSLIKRNIGSYFTFFCKIIPDVCQLSAGLSLEPVPSDLNKWPWAQNVFMVNILTYS